MLTLSRRALIASAIMLVSRPGAVSTPRRIVSIGGAVTEILYRLGIEEQVVGVDTTSQFPPEALKTRASVGYVRALGAEGVLSLNPTLVIAIEGAGPPDSLRLIEQAGIPILRISDEPSPEGISRRISDIARAVDRSESGVALTREVVGGFERLADLRARVTTPVRTLFILSLQNGCVLSSAGREQPRTPCWPCRAPLMRPRRWSAGNLSPTRV